ncbi:unnamed protein product [Ambrosiozyma monospora]|uniref:Unnamed protein product n=1 Tax=Ambrosiozyma monospora TaxID=43982 RepID=A0A9W7DJ39_AMBMO|nr:unnamed protein product [Ambrosiozyma monospora]
MADLHRKISSPRIPSLSNNNRTRSPEFSITPNSNSISHSRIPIPTMASRIPSNTFTSNLSRHNGTTLNSQYDEYDDDGADGNSDSYEFGVLPSLSPYALSLLQKKSSGGSGSGSGSGSGAGEESYNNYNNNDNNNESRSGNGSGNLPISSNFNFNFNLNSKFNQSNGNGNVADGTGSSSLSSLKKHRLTLNNDRNSSASIYPGKNNNNSDANINGNGNGFRLGLSREVSDPDRLSRHSFKFMSKVGLGAPRRITDDDSNNNNNKNSLSTNNNNSNSNSNINSNNDFYAADNNTNTQEEIKTSYSTNMFSRTDKSGMTNSTHGYGYESTTKQTQQPQTQSLSLSRSHSRSRSLHSQYSNPNLNSNINLNLSGTGSQKHQLSTSPKRYTTVANGNGNTAMTTSASLTDGSGGGSGQVRSPVRKKNNMNTTPYKRTRPILSMKHAVTSTTTAAVTVPESYSNGAGLNRLSSASTRRLAGDDDQDFDLDSDLLPPPKTPVRSGTRIGGGGAGAGAGFGRIDVNDDNFDVFASPEKGRRAVLTPLSKHHENVLPFDLFAEERNNKENIPIIRQYESHQFQSQQSLVQRQVSLQRLRQQRELEREEREQQWELEHQQQQQQQRPSAVMGGFDQKYFKDILEKELKAQKEQILKEVKQEQAEMAAKKEEQDREREKLKEQLAKEAKSIITINSKDYECLDVVGTGGSSKVYRAKEKNGKRTYAIKVVTFDEHDESAVSEFKGEIGILKKLRNEKRVVKMIDYSFKSDSMNHLMLDSLGIMSPR